MRLECIPGPHTITFEYRNDNGDVKSSMSLVVEVISGRETTISGNIDESKVTSGSSSLTEVKQAIEVKKEGDTVVNVLVAPANTSSNLNQSTVTFEAGSFTKDSTNAVLNLSVTSAGGEFSVGSLGSSAPIACIDISLLVNGEEVTSFNGKEVKIETYIAKNLDNVQVFYNGTPSEVKNIPNYVDDNAWFTSGTIEGYSKESGKLVFKTTHFSEYFFIANEVVAYNSTTNVAYSSFLTAFNSLGNNESLILIKDTTINAENENISQPLLVPENSIYSIDLNGHTLSYIGYNTEVDSFCVRPFIIYGTLEVNNNSKDEGKGGIEVLTWQTYGIFDIKSGGTLKINGGYYHSEGANGGALIRGREGSYIEIKDGAFIVTGNGSTTGTDGAMNTEGDSVIYNGIFKSTSTSYNNNNWSYTLRSSGNMTLHYAEVEGVQGGIGIYGGTSVIYDAKSTINESIYGINYSFYPLYIAGEKLEVSCIVKGGTYTSPNRYALYCGNNTEGDGGNRLDSRVNVLGGTYIVNNDKLSSAIYVDENKGTAIIKSGVFNKPIDSKYIAEGYYAKQNEDGNYEVTSI